MKIPCRRCGGSGHDPISEPRQQCLDALKRLGTATRLEIHEATAATGKLTATHQQIRRLLKAGAVERIGAERPARYRVAV